MFGDGQQSSLRGVNTWGVVSGYIYYIVIYYIRSWNLTDFMASTLLRCRFRSQKFLMDVFTAWPCTENQIDKAAADLKNTNVKLKDTVTKVNLSCELNFGQCLSEIEIKFVEQCFSCINVVYLKLKYLCWVAVEVKSQLLHRSHFDSYHPRHCRLPILVSRNPDWCSTPIISRRFLCCVTKITSKI